LKTVTTAVKTCFSLKQNTFDLSHSRKEIKNSNTHNTIKMNKRQLLPTALLLFGSFYSFNAQKWSCAAQVGTTAYLGDVNENLLWQPKLNRTAIGGSVGCEALDFMTVRLNVVGGQLSGSDAENTTTAWRKLRAFSFQTPFVEASVLTEWDVLKAVFGDR
jgi:hypothetical protein